MSKKLPFSEPTQSFCWGWSLRYELVHGWERGVFRGSYSLLFATHFLLTLGNFKRHKLTHSGVKAFGCQYCESKFTTPAGQKQHEATHSAVKPYSCKLCDKSYVNSSKLRTHVLTAHAAKKPTCKFCDKSYVNLSKLKAHILNKHADENPPNDVMWKLNDYMRNGNDFTEYQIPKSFSSDNSPMTSV